MQKKFYFTTPLEVVEVTRQNLQEVADWCGGKVAQAESRRVPGRMDSYVWVPTPKNTGISWAFPGMFITRRLVVTVKGEIKETWAVFRRDYFEKNYFETPDAAIDATWALPKSAIAVEEKPEHITPAQIVINVNSQQEANEIMNKLAPLPADAAL